MSNPGVKPVGRAVLVEPYELQVQKGLIEIPASARERSVMLEDRAVVLEIGPECWRDEMQPRAQVGDRILIVKYAGSLVKGPADGKTYRMINDRDIVAVITEEKDNGGRTS